MEKGGGEGGDRLSKLNYYGSRRRVISVRTSGGLREERGPLICLHVSVGMHTCAVTNP